MSDYVELDELKAASSLSGETFADPDLERAITAASRGIDNETRRRFWLDADANQVRYYTPSNSGPLLLIDDLVQLTAVAIDPAGAAAFDQPWTQNQHFVLEPLNAPADGWPWTAIRAVPRGQYTFPVGYLRSVKVTGKFGWPAVPVPVKEATIITASRLVKRTREAPFGVVSMGMDAAARIAREDPDVCSLLKPYTRGAGVSGLA